MDLPWSTDRRGCNWLRARALIKRIAPYCPLKMDIPNTTSLHHYSEMFASAPIYPLKVLYLRTIILGPIRLRAFNKMTALSPNRDTYRAEKMRYLRFLEDYMA